MAISRARGPELGKGSIRAFMDGLGRRGQARARAWEELAEEFRVPLLAVALHFAFLPAVVEAVAVGVKSAAEVEGALDLLSVDIPERLWAEAVRRGLLPEDSVASLLLPEEAEAEG